MIIRHSSSFFFSFLFHTFLAVMIIFAYRNMPSFKVEKEKKVCVKLSCVVAKKTVVAKKQPQPKKKIIKKIKPKPKPKPKKIHKLKHKPKHKLKPKKSKPVKTVPVVMPIKKEPIKKIEPEVKKTMPDKVVEEVKEVEEITDAVEENPHAKQEQMQKEYMQNHLAKIVKLLQDNLYYPRSARKRGIVGKVVVEFKLLRDSNVENIEVISSKREILSRSAIKTIQSLSGKFPKPEEDLVIKVPIEYRLK